MRNLFKNSVGLIFFQNIKLCNLEEVLIMENSMAVGTAGKGGLKLRNGCEKKLNLFSVFLSESAC